jgi:hypothetical protein
MHHELSRRGRGKVKEPSAARGPRYFACFSFIWMAEKWIMVIITYKLRLHLKLL